MTKITSRLFRITLVFTILLSFSNCKKTDLEKDIYNINSVKFVSEKIDVKTFQVISLKSKGSFSQKYNGTFGTVPLVLVKSSDSTLAFIVPEIAAGEYLLKFDSTAIRYQVTKTTETNPDQLASSILQELDSYVSSLNSTAPIDTAYIKDVRAFRSNVSAKYNDQTTEERKLTALFYQANQELFKLFEDNASKVLDAKITLRQISTCPNTTYHDYGICIADNLYPLLYNLNEALIPASVPTKFTDEYQNYVRPFTSAIYLIMSHRPRILEFRRSINQYLSLPWIFNENLFDNIQTIYPDEAFKDMNIKASYRTIDPNKDKYLSRTTNHFFDIMDVLNKNWSLLPFLGPFPQYSYITQPTTLTTSEITIKIIEPSKVVIGDRAGQSVAFNSLSNSTEYFNFNIQVSRQGFFAIKDNINAKVEAFDSLPLYKASIVGNWKVDNTFGGVYALTQDKTLRDDGTALTYQNVAANGTVTVFNPPQVEGWNVIKNSTGYHFVVSGARAPYPYSLIYPVTYILAENGDPGTSYKYYKQ